MRTLSVLSALLLITLLSLAIGCGKNSSDSTMPPRSEAQPDTRQPFAKTEEHAHKRGAHDGLIIAIGRDNYHAEVVFDQNGVIRLYTLGKDETKVQDVEVQTLEAFVKPSESIDATPITFKAVPQNGDAAGKTSQFTGQLPAELRGKTLSVTVPSITIAGERFRFSFSTATQREEPVLADSDEKKLYLTPGGLYTEADIKANGTMTALQKYANFNAAHDRKPRSGDRVCPITDTKANPKCTWIVGGKTYEFCCPPCIDEFVQQAKEHPEQIKKPEDYLKK